MAAETPLVHRTVRGGAILLVIGAVQFLASYAVAASQFAAYAPGSTRPTDLFGTGSVANWLVDSSLVAGGVVAAFGLLLIWSAFDARPSRGVGLLLLIASAACAVAYGASSMLGLAPGGLVRSSEFYAGTALLGLGLLVLPFAMSRQDRWRFSRIYTSTSGLLVFVAGAIYLTGFTFGLARGGIEFAALMVAVFWPIVEGGHIALLHRFAPGLHVKVAAA